MKIGWQSIAFAIILIVSSVSAEGKCKVCDSTDPKCQTDPSSVEEKSCETECFTLIDSSDKIKRGCVNENEEKCLGKNCKTCKLETDKACNIQTDFFWCKTCDSSNMGDCAYWKNPNSIPNELCESGVKKCLMEIKTDKHTSRRCASNNEEVCSNEKNCKICEGSSSCNKGIFPESRLQCFQCSSSDSKCATPTKFSTDISSFPCLLYEESDKCFEHGTSETAMSRGCLSDTTAYEKCTSEKEKCKECTADKCNIDEYLLSPTEKCIQCKSDDPKCAGAHTSEEAATCSSKIEYWKSHGCYTNKIEVGKAAKGCIADFDCASASATCTSCTGAACNIGAANAPSCYKCRSDENSNCSKKLDKESFKSESCRNPIESNAADVEQCYVELWNGIVIRSCLVDADPKTRKNCLNPDYKACTTCKGDNCNSYEAPNSAYNIALSSGLFACALSLMALKFF